MGWEKVNWNYGNLDWRKAAREQSSAGGDPHCVVKVLFCCNLVQGRRWGYVFWRRRSPLLFFISIEVYRRMRWADNVLLMGEERGVYRVLVGKPEGKRPLGRPRRRWVDNIRMNLQEVGCLYMDWIGRAQDRDRWRTLVSAVMNLRVPWNAENFLTSCKPVSFSWRTLHHGVSK